MQHYFVISKKVAKKTIEHLKPFVNTNAVLPILYYFLVELGKFGVRISASNAQDYISHTPNLVEYKGECSFCLHSKYFEWFCNKAIGENITVSFDKEICTMESGGIKVKVKTEKMEGYVKETTMPVGSLVFHNLHPTDFNKVEVDFAEECGKALDFISNDDLRPAMTGLSFEEKNGHVCIVATDAHRLFYKVISPTTHKEFSFILPLPFCQAMDRSFRKASYTVQFSDTHVQVSNDDTVLTSRMIDAKFPNWKVVIPKELPVSVEFDRDAMIDYLDCALPFTNHSTHQITATLHKDKMKLSGRDFDEAQSEYELPLFDAKGVDTPLRFAFNGVFMKECLSISYDTMALLQHPGSEHKGMMLDNQCLLMPLMTNGND